MDSWGSTFEEIQAANAAHMAHEEAENKRRARHALLNRFSAAESDIVAILKDFEAASVAGTVVPHTYLGIMMRIADALDDNG